MELIYKVKEKNLTINNILQSKLGISSRLFAKLLNNNCVRCNSLSCDTRQYAQIGDTISVDLGYFEDNSNIIATKMDLNIVYEDKWLIILNKPRSQATHPSIAHFDSSISNGLKYYFDSIGLNKKIRPINRLDYNTSGLIVFAKNEYIQDALIKQMVNNIFKKQYLAVVHGNFKEKNGTIKLPISRKQGSIIERCICENGKNAITHYEVLGEVNNCSLVKCLLVTGRTHQIRVHFAAIGHPLVGDSLYGKKDELIDGQVLHCHSIQFIHPITNIPLKFNSFSIGDGPFW